MEPLTFENIGKNSLIYISSSNDNNGFDLNTCEIVNNIRKSDTIFKTFEFFYKGEFIKLDIDETKSEIQYKHNDKDLLIFADRDLAIERFNRIFKYYKFIDISLK